MFDAYYRTQNPATEEIEEEFNLHTEKEASDKVMRVGEGLRLWKNKTLAERCQAIGQLLEVLKREQDLCAQLMSLEMGKPITESRHEIGKCLLGLDIFIQTATQALTPHSYTASNLASVKNSYVRYEPLGVILGIMPWNFPFWQVIRFAVPALLAGNTVLLKHAPNVPQCALMLEELFRHAGLESIFQNLFIMNDEVQKLIERDVIQGVSLTGSSRAGSQVAQIAGKSLKKTVLELGGSDPFIVLEDADLVRAVEIGVKSRMINAGQSCIAAKRFLVHHKIAPTFQKLFVEKLQSMRCGDPMLEETELGPLAREDLLENLIHQVGEAKKQGCVVETGGQRIGRQGYFYAPTFLSHVKEGMVPFVQEVFGPVAAMTEFRDEEEAVYLANATSYGLGASLWTRDLEKAERLAAQIEAGSVFINALVKSDPALPFGGIKKSGYGRELSEVGMREFTNIKTVWVGL